MEIRMNPLFDLNLKAAVAKCKTIEDLTGPDGLLKRLLSGMIEQMLEAEMEDHLGYEKHNPMGYGSGNSRNGTTSKKSLQLKDL